MNSNLLFVKNLSVIIRPCYRVADFLPDKILYSFYAESTEKISVSDDSCDYY